MTEMPQVASGDRIFTSTRTSKGEVVANEQVCCAIQTVSSSLQACAFCGRPCGCQVETLKCNSTEAIGQFDKGNDDTAPRPSSRPSFLSLRCPSGPRCRAVFCSVECQTSITKPGRHFGWHKLLCLGEESPTGDEAFEFSAYCERTSETFLLAATVLAKMTHSTTKDSVMRILHTTSEAIPWHIVAARSRLAATEVEYADFNKLSAILQEEISQAWHLLGYWSKFEESHAKELTNYITFDIFENIAAIVEVRFKPVTLDTIRGVKMTGFQNSRTAERYCEGAVDDPISTCFDNHSAQCKLEHSNDELHTENAFISLVASPTMLQLEHSCTPNVQMEIASDDHNRIELVALHEMAVGENVLISYVSSSAPVERRQRVLLGHFGIICHCPRCCWEMKTNYENVDHEQYYRLSLQYLEEGRYEQSASLLRYLLTRNSSADALHLLGQCFISQGKWRLAHRIWYYAYELYPENRSLRMQIAKDRLYFQEGRMGLGLPFNHMRSLTEIAQDVWTSSSAILDEERCNTWITLAESSAARCGGWATSRHYNVPTTDIAIHTIPAILREWNQLVHQQLYPLMSQLLPGLNRGDIFVHDAFIVKYDAAGGQTFLPPHVDEGHWSLTISLNSTVDYEGGGTIFHPSGLVVQPEIGNCVAFRSTLKHSGAYISRGVRYIVAAFLFIDN